MPAISRVTFATKNILVYLCTTSLTRWSQRWCRRWWCHSSQHNWMQMASLQLAASASGGTGTGFFRDICVDLTSQQLACTETCDGVYRTFTGCCNNLINTEYGQIIQFQNPNISQFPCRKYQHSSQEVFQHSGLSVGNTAQRGTYRL